jgi:alpha-L-arabinofuranosidase
LKIEIAGRRIRCSLDGTLVHDETAPAMDRFFAVAGMDEKASEIVLKAVSTASEPARATLDLRGANVGNGEARLIVIQAHQLDANNSFEEPTKVAPVESRTDVQGPKFTHEFPPRSMTVMRLKIAR